MTAGIIRRSTVAFSHAADGGTSAHRVTLETVNGAEVRFTVWHPWFGPVTDWFPRAVLDEALAGWQTCRDRDHSPPANGRFIPLAIDAVRCYWLPTGTVQQFVSDAAGVQIDVEWAAFCGEAA